jgi:hypothetical protein
MRTARDSRRYHNQYNRALKLRVIKLLGGSCVRCGFADERALQLDHVDGGGCMDNRSVNIRGRLLRILRGEGPPIQLLCANCNWIKRFEQLEHGSSSSSHRPVEPEALLF